MILNRTLILALTVTSGAALAAILAVQRRSRLLDEEQTKKDLQRWEDETGSFASPNVTKAEL